MSLAGCVHPSWLVVDRGVDGTMVLEENEVEKYIGGGGGVKIELRVYFLIPC